jgi:hypothetical protein
MQTIEIDFDVYKALTLRRQTEDVTYNDVLRELLELDPVPSPQKNLDKEQSGEPWVIKGVSFPHGTEFSSTYKGRQYSGFVDNGALVVNGKRFNSPSAAAISITKNSVNGWIFWKCKIPGLGNWTTISSLREQ